MVYRAASLALLLTTLAATTVQAFRVPLPLGELIGSADAVVVGLISEVGDATFTIEIEQVAAGEVKHDAIEVARFAAPVESPRWADYSAGQRIVVFLARRRVDLPASQAPPGAWRILGRLGEGEIPVEGDWAYFHRRWIDMLPAEHHRFHGQSSYLQRIRLDVLLEAIRDYRGCFDWPDAPPGEGRPVLTCSLTEVCELSRHSPLHEFLLDEVDEIRERR